MTDDWRLNIIHPEDDAPQTETTVGAASVMLETPRKPRLVLMGEFSAGKSTLTNILLDSQPLPMKVTATRLPPVQITHGAPAAFAVSHDGSRIEIGLDALEDVSLDSTTMIEVQMEAEVLELCDIIDMPGISDPNMPVEMWENVVGKNDHVIWCTHATQAWRQSEAAIWNTLKDQSSGRNLLLVTQFDKLRNDRDKGRVLKRVAHETAGLFESVYPVSLLAALDAGEDYDIWKASGAADFSEHVIRVLVERESSGAQAAPQANDLRRPSTERADLATTDEALAQEAKIMPRRISARPTARSVPQALPIADMREGRRL